MIDELLKEMIDKGGSDLHICVGKPPFARLADGFLHPLKDNYPLSRGEVEYMLNKIARTDNIFVRLLEKEEQDFTYESKIGRFRVNISLSRGLPFAVIRELKTNIPSPDALGISSRFIEAVSSASYGLVVIAGTTGSGKSTTMASVMNHILQREPVRVITIEDPIEYLIGSEKDAVSQREVGKDTLSFAAALRAAMRQDPDYIIVGEVRDIETARNAVIAAETGHIVFVTVHAKSSTSAIDRFCGVFPVEEQRMIRRRLTDNLILSQTQVIVPSVHKGRRLATELLVVDTDETRDELFEGKVNDVRAKMEKGICGWTLNQSLKELLDKGEITEDTYDSYRLN